MSADKAKLLLINTYDSDGAGKAAYSFHANCLATGYFSRLYVQEKSKKDDTIIEHKRSLVERIYDPLFYRLISLKPKTIPRYHFHNTIEGKKYPSAKRILHNAGFVPDVIIIFWISRFMNSETIRELYDHTRAKVILVHCDMSILTGGCHYAWECQGYISDCLDCPAIVEKKNKHLAHKALALKKTNLKEVEMYSMVSSAYISKRIDASAVCGKQGKWISKIGTDPETFKPGNMEMAMARFGISQGKKVIVVGASNLAEERKGFDHAISVLNKLHSRGAEFMALIIGETSEDLNQLLNCDFRPAGFLSKTDLILAYQAAHLFLCTSIEDGGPQMVNQAIMCGTPVVGYDTGAIPDLVIHGETGYPVPNGDQDKMVEALQKMLQMNDHDHQQMSQKARNLALREISIDRQNENLSTLFNNILK